jgi:non-heme chloroperoxidase
MSTNVLPTVQTYEARDGRSLCYRLYPANSDRIILLLHGISEDGQYLHPLAEFISKQHLAQVYVPDLRGYGAHPIRRGDVEYIGQHDDDLEDLVKWIERQSHSPFTLMIAGHSAGGTTAIRLAVKPLASKIGAFLLLAPAIHPNAPTSPKKDPGSTLHINTPRIAALTFLNAMGLRFFNHWIVMRNDKQPARRHGRETLELSYRLLLSRMLKTKYELYLQAMTQPTLVLAGEKDEVFLPGQYGQLFAEHNKAHVRIIPNSDHDGLLSSSETFQEVEKWFREL